MADDILPGDPAPDDRNVLAGEYALGVLEGDALTEAQRLYLQDRDFAEMVGWWNHRLACMGEAVGEYDPSADVWPAIVRSLDSEGGGAAPVAPVPLQQPAARTGVSGWMAGLGMAGAAAAAAVLTFVIVGPGRDTATPVPVETPATQGPRLVAQAQSEDGALQLATVVDPETGRLSLTTAGFDPGEGRALELWVVPAGGAPQSLGLVPAQGQFARDLTTEERGLLVEGATLAVTYENATGAPHDAPSTDILAASGLATV